MDERNEQDERLSQRPPAEGVRIIRAEEAQAALEAGQAAGRQPEDAPRFGDVPAQPAGPRPHHRFPLPDSVDPASAVPRSPVRPDLPPQPTAAAPQAPNEPDLAPPEDGITLQSASGPELPHWTDPPTGEVPRILPESAGSGEHDDLAAWQALGSRGLRWRDEASDWDDLEDVGTLGGEETRLGALDTTRSEHSDMFSFDEQFERLGDQRSGQYGATVDPGLDADSRADSPAAGGSPGQVDPGSAAGTQRGAGRGPPRQGDGERDLRTAVGVGVILLGLLLVAYAIGPLALVWLAAIVVTASALELYNVIQHRGFRPATLLGLCATVAVMFAAYWRGEQALPLVLVLVFVTSMLWYMLEVVEARPVVNVALTVMVFVWVGLLGSYAALLLRVHHGKSLLLLPVLVTVAADVIAYAAGSTLGSRPLAPHISPGKTWEGVIVGLVGAALVSMLIGRVFLHNTWTVKHALILGLVVGVVAPIGDLCESMVKRDLHLKDSGGVLPGHGGLLDRFDGLLFVLPAAYYLIQYFKLH
ncbi:MAG TPA: CDP-archaeol synthase [Acidimicrobiales bacterium]|nr:CDP-archaeol synthase [Acidimicrobiales bacterium]